ncbi:MAG: VWA domain-containing protein [Hyphomicrobiales bacterium]|nr:VWA domain-containing protein [Hyphomicrobiales bacterium]
MFSLAILVFVAGIGLAVDYTRATSAKVTLQNMLDSAVLAASKEDTQAGAETRLSNFVAAHSSNLESAEGVSATIVSFDADKVVATASATVTTTFGGVVGIPSINMTAHSTANRVGGYRSIYFALDFSSSLGMGATAADRQALEDLTKPYVGAFYGTRLPQGCAFACHRREGWEPGTKTLYETARDAGIKLREDELLTQFSGLVDLLLDPNDQIVQNSQRTVSVIGFSSSVKHLITPSNSAATVKASLANFPKVDRFETKFADAFSAISTILGTQGNGTQTNPTKMLVLITDGIESRDAFFAQKAIDVSLCTAVKNKGFTLAVVEIKYPKLTSNALYNDTLLPVETTISPAMQQCASPGWYFAALNNVDVPGKFAELKTKILAEARRLTK